jgi:hypothetical protein
MAEQAQAELCHLRGVTLRSYIQVQFEISKPVDSDASGQAWRAGTRQLLQHLGDVQVRIFPGGLGGATPGSFQFALMGAGSPEGFFVRGDFPPYLFSRPLLLVIHGLLLMLGLAVVLLGLETGTQTGGNDQCHTRRADQ